MFISPTNNWQAADYPPFQSAAYLQEDNNEPLWLDVELPFTINGAMAQRLSKIALRRARHQITVQGQFKLTAYQVQPLDVVQLSHPRFGWVNKTFEVADCTLSYAPDAAGAPALCVDLTLREADSTIYDWTTADEIAISAPPVPTLPQNAIAQPPTGLTVSTAEIIRVVDGVRTSYIGLTWTAPADQFVTSGGHITVQYKKHTDTNWTDIGKLKGNVIVAQIGPVIDGTLYDIQMWAENSSGVISSTVTASATPTGTSVTIDTISDGSVYARSPIVGGSSIVVENGSFEASGSILPPPGWVTAGTGAALTLSYDTSTQYSGARSLVVVTPGSSQQTLLSLRKYAVRAGDVFRISARILDSSGLNGAVALFFYDGNGTAIGTATAQSSSGSWTFVSASAIAPAGTAYARVLIAGSNFSSGSTTEYDEIHVARMQTSFEVTPINTSAAPTATATALTQSGTTTTINVATKTFQYGDGQVVYSAGSVNPGAYGTYFVYADDPGFAGGAVTYLASTLESDVYGANGRIYFGKITTAGGGGGTGGTGGGAGGGRSRLS
jgi:hypothetical protein